MEIKNNKIISAVGKDFLAKIFSSWFFTGAILFFFGSGDAINAQMFQTVNVIVAIVLFLVFFAAQTAVRYFLDSDRTAPICVLASASLLAIEASMKVSSSFALLGFAALIFLAARYAYLAKLEIDVAPKLSLITAIGVAVIATVFVSAIVILRLLIYTAPNFDFGIFCNIYYNLKENFQPLSTCERDKLLSHFAVHFSPILYLLLPIYYIFPSEMTLQIAQVVLLMSGIIPLWLLMRKYNLNATVKLFLAIGYC